MSKNQTWNVNSNFYLHQSVTTKIIYPSLYILLITPYNSCIAFITHLFIKRKRINCKVLPCGNTMLYSQYRKKRNKLTKQHTFLMLQFRSCIDFSFSATCISVFSQACCTTTSADKISISKASKIISTSFHKSLLASFSLFFSFNMNLRTSFNSIVYSVNKTPILAQIFLYIQNFYKKFREFVFPNQSYDFFLFYLMGNHNIKPIQRFQMGKRWYNWLLHPFWVLFLYFFTRFILKFLQNIIWKPVNQRVSI